MTATAALLRAYQHSLTAINGATLVQRWARSPSAAELTHAPIYLLAIGKAAPAMARGAALCWSTRIQDALIITHRDNHSACPYSVTFAAHPVVDESSLVAGQQALSFVKKVPQGAVLLVLMSGGASALCEVLVRDLSLATYQKIMRYLLSHSIDIAGINAVRKRLSQIKGGGLLRACNDGVHVMQCSISDVANDEVAVIGSGPFVSDNTASLPALPEWITNVLRNTETVDTKHRVEHFLLASNRQWLHSFSSALNMQLALCDILRGDAVEMAQQCAERVRAGEPGLYLWGGELTVALPEHAGKGGRLQHFALALMSQLRGVAVHALAASSDGRDGQSDAAGVLLSTQQIQQISQCNRQINAAIARADSYAFWQQFGGQLFTSATETNVADMVAIIKE